MLHRIREAMETRSFVKLGSDGGPVEIDETFVGPKPQKMHRDKRLALQNGIKAPARKLPSWECWSATLGKSGQR